VIQTHDHLDSLTPEFMNTAREALLIGN